MSNTYPKLPAHVEKVWNEYSDTNLVCFSLIFKCIQPFLGEQSKEYLSSIILAVSDVKDDSEPSSDHPVYQEAYKIALTLKLHN